jgi:aryl-alcohol dehydrogenase-like predicted oxidoreductase
MVWSPLAGGLLSGKYRKGESRMPTAAAPASTSRRSTRTAPGNHRRAARDRRGEGSQRRPDRAFPGCFHQPAVSSVIVGARQADQLADNLGSVRRRADRRGIVPASTSSAVSLPNIPAG